MAEQPFRIVFAIYPNVTQLDFTGPHQVFSRLPNSRVITASATGGTIETDGLHFANLTRLSDIDACELVCIPGGYGVTDAINDEVYMREVKRLAAGAKYITSVCVGSLVLGAAGLLKGKRAACHWAWRDLLEPFGAIADPARVVRDGNIISGGGVTAGIDFALSVAAEVAGQATAEAIQLTIEYAPEPPFNAGSPETAPPKVLAAIRERLQPLVEMRRKAITAAAARLEV